jgi:cytochrome c oxidase assembly protein subunit 15
MTFALAADRGTSDARPQLRGQALLRGWLWLLIGLVFAMVVIGGATRLTGSGLSITEWKPVTGAIPPLSDAQWAAEFEKYRQIPQYQLINKGMSLGEFKEIFWWEWSHRQLGRLIGLIYGLGFIGFVLAGVARGKLLLALAGLGALGGLQGAIGWIMVASGLQPGMTAVAPVKLMAHLTTASLIFTGLLATVVSLTPPRSVEPAHSGLRRLAGWTVAAVLAQIALGALVAGSKAGLIYNTWPLIDGAFVPPLSSLFFSTPWFENLVDNHLTVQFNHRMVAYALLALVLVQAWRARSLVPGTGAARRTVVIAGLVLAQGVVGIATLLTQVPLGLGLLHQGMAMVVLAMAIVHWQQLKQAS